MVIYNLYNIDLDISPRMWYNGIMKVRNARKNEQNTVWNLDKTCFEEEISWKPGITKVGGVDCGTFWIVAYGHMQDDGFIDRIGVHPGSRHQGYGRQILKSLIATARRRGLPRVYTYVDRANTASLMLFLKSEFRTVGRVAGVRWIQMERQI